MDFGADPVSVSVGVTLSCVKIFMIELVADWNQGGTCIKGLFWPPLEPKIESCFSPISSYWFV